MAFDPNDRLEFAIREFCYGAGRSISRSVFLGRVVGPSEPLWLDEDRVAALEWQTYQNSLCPNCKLERSVTFDIANDDRFDVTVIRCHACAARTRKAALHQDHQQPVTYSDLYIVTLEEDDGVAPVADAR